MDEKHKQSLNDLSRQIGEQLDNCGASFLGCFLINSAIQFTLADLSGNIIFITYEEDADFKVNMSLRDISGPFEAKTDYAEGVIKININETTKAVYIISILILEALKLKVDAYELLKELLDIRIVDMRK